MNSDVTGEAAEPKQFTVVTAATVSCTDLGRTMAWSVEVAELVTMVTGQSVAFRSSAAGPMFQVGWISGADMPEEFDAALAAGNTDSG